MPSISLVPADALDPASLHAAFTRAFADYVLGPFQVPLTQWPGFLGRQAVQLAPSRAAVLEGEIVAFCLAAPRNDRACWRLGTMGALPAARGQGAAALLLQDFIDRARAAKQMEVELECFAQNERALRLYRRFGFVPVHELFGFAGSVEGLAQGPRARHGAEAEAGVLPQPTAIDLEQAFRALDAFSRRDGALPLQVTPQSLRALPVALRAWRCGDAWLVTSETGADKLTLHALVDASASQDDAGSLVHHVAALHPQRTLHVPQLQRDDLGGRALRRMGLAPLPLHQRLMRLPL